MPEIETCLANRELNISQIAILCQGLRETAVPASLEKKREILAALKENKNAQEIVAKMLTLPPKTHEKKKAQADGSMRIEFTLSKEQVELLTQVKNEMSHINPNPSMAEVFVHLARKALKKPNSKLHHKPASARYVSQAKRNELFKNQGACQWPHSDGTKCGSHFQLEVDHIQAVSDGGTSELGNLQLLCRVHNRIKYELILMDCESA